MPTARRFRPRVESLESRLNPSPTSTTLFSYPDPSFYGQPVTFTAVVEGSAPGVGVVYFYADGSPYPFATASVINGEASATYPNPPLGIHTITAQYSGGYDYINFQTDDPSWSGVLLQQTILPAAPAAPAPAGQAVHHHAHHHGHHHHHR
jgi:hypothetical protein